MLGLEISRELTIDLVLQSLPDTFDEYLISYNMHGMKKSLTELHGMLKTIELNIKSSSKVLMMQKGKNPKKKEHDQGKDKGKVTVKTSKVDAFGAPRPRIKSKEPKSPKEGEYYHCKKIGNWKRNCPLYLKYLKKNKESVPFTSSNFVISQFIYF